MYGFALKTAIQDGYKRLEGEYIPLSRSYPGDFADMVRLLLNDYRLRKGHGITDAMYEEVMQYKNDMRHPIEELIRAARI